MIEVTVVDSESDRALKRGAVVQATKKLLKREEIVTPLPQVSKTAAQHCPIVTDHP
jgi:hypothetical protein